MKRLFALVLALIMVMSLATTAFADDSAPAATTPPTYTLTINNTANGHTYEAYQIFAGDLHVSTTTGEDGTTTTKEVLSNIEWGEGVHSTDKLLLEIQNNSKLTLLKGATDAATLASLLKSVSSDSDTLDEFAAVVGKYLTALPQGTSTDAGNYYTISGLEAGYYLVKDKDGSLEDDDDFDTSYTKFILRVVKDTAVNPKSDVPSVDKYINDTLGGTYTEHEDFDITDIAYYKWEGTLPSNLTSYDKYFYQFVDTLPEGIVFNAIQQVYLEGHDGNIVHTFYDITDSSTANDTFPEAKDKDGNTVKDENGNPIKIHRSITGKTASITETGISYSTEYGSGNSNITLTFDDLFKLYPNVQNTHKIVVKYTAVISSEIAIGTPLENKVHINYSNNPNGAGTGKSTDDSAYAYSFDIKVEKYDQDNPSLKLENAIFYLYYTRIENDLPVNYYAKVVTEEMINKGVQVNGILMEGKHLGIVYGWTTDRKQASELDTDVHGEMHIKGLDADTYFLEEIQAPAGYNKMENPVQIDIKPTYASNGSSLEKLSYEVDSIAQSSNTVGVRNAAGSTLPITGGMGTTIFYVLGSVLVLGAVVMLITKKRMAFEN